MRNWLQNKYVILSGASGGIGRELCKLLVLKFGAKVVGIGRSQEKMQSLQRELQEKGATPQAFRFELFDVGQRKNWEMLREKLQAEGIFPVLLVNNAGAFPRFSCALNTDTQTTETILQTNFLSAVYAVKALSPILQGEGKNLPAIVNVSSSAALCTVVGTAAYSASKSALKGYTEALALEEKGKKYVGIVYPGTTKTELFRNDKNTENSALDIVAMPAEKMAGKIARAILKKKKRAILGWDAKAMNLLAKCMPVKGLYLIRGVMKKSGSKVFSAVFSDEKNQSN